MEVGSLAVRELVSVIRDATRMIDASYRAQLAGDGISLSVAYALKGLGEGKAISQRELATRIGTTEPTVAAVLVRMEMDQLVTRVRSDQDKRRKLVMLTAEGRRALRAVVAAEARLDGVASQHVDSATASALAESLRSFVSDIGSSLSKNRLNDDFDENATAA
jgi:DNA-binding MarR family transcriptional regulator